MSPGVATRLDRAITRAQACYGADHMGPARLCGACAADLVDEARQARDALTAAEAERDRARDTAIAELQRLHSIIDAERADADTLAEALRGAKGTADRLRQHCSEDHEGCGYAVLGILDTDAADALAAHDARAGRTTSRDLGARDATAPATAASEPDGQGASHDVASSQAPPLSDALKGAAGASSTGGGRP